jgi:hypothetical protein
MKALDLIYFFTLINAPIQSPGSHQGGASPLLPTFSYSITAEPAL